jgi:hypothetical protein
MAAFSSIAPIRQRGKRNLCAPQQSVLVSFLSPILFLKGSAFVVAQPSRLEGESLPHMTSVLGDDERLTAIAQRLAIKFQQPIWFHADVTAERGDADAVWRFIEKSLVDALKRELATTAP